MRTSIAILLGSGVIGLSILATGLGIYYLSDRYELATIVDSGGAVGLRLNKRTGAVALCGFVGGKTCSTIFRM
jgi:hypothetical protein